MGYRWSVILLAIPSDGSLGRDVAGRIWDKPMKKGYLFNEVFVFGGLRRLVAGVGRIELVDDIGLEPTTPTMSTWCSNQLS